MERVLLSLSNSAGAIGRYHLFLRCILIGVMVLLPALPQAVGQSEYGWEGSAVAARSGELPSDGAYAASNIVMPNSVVRITNLDTGGTAQATVVRRLSQPGVLARVSQQVADELGIEADETASVLITTVSPAAAAQVDPDHERPLSPDPDINPSAAVGRTAAPDSSPELLSPDTAEVERDKPDVLPDVGDIIGDLEAPQERPGRSEDDARTPRPAEPRPSLPSFARPPAQVGERDPDDLVSEDVIAPTEEPVQDHEPVPEERREPEDERVPDDERQNRLEEALERARSRVPRPRYFAAPADPDDPIGLPRREPEREEFELLEPRDPSIVTVDEPDSVDEAEPGEELELPEMIDPRVATADSDPEPAPEPEADREPREPRRVLEDVFDRPRDEVEQEPDAPELRERLPTEPIPEEADEPDQRKDLGGLPLVDTLEQDAYYLQVGAYREADSIRRVVESLEPRYPVSVTGESREEGALYRIFVGPLNRDERGATLFSVRALGFEDAFVKRGGGS